MKIVLTTISLALVGLTLGMTPKEFMDKVGKNYLSLDSYALAMEYQLFKGYDSNEIVEREEGFLAKNETGMYTNQFGNETVATKEYMANIDHNTKRVFVTAPIALSPIGNDIAGALKWCRDARVKGLKNGSTKITFTFKPNNGIPYRQMSIQVSKSYWVEEVTFHFTELTNFSQTYFKQDYQVAKVKVIYKDLKKKWKDKEGILNAANFFDKNEAGSLIGKGNLATYEITDYRFMNKPQGLR